MVRFRGRVRVYVRVMIVMYLFTGCYGRGGAIV